MIETNWQPTASIKHLQQRAEYIHKIRQFFYHSSIFEVETPLMYQFTVTDPYVNAIETVSQYGRGYLQTSPEYFMKRLLAAGSGSIFQICKCFRDDPIGKLHNPEFTMLEWYHQDNDLCGLMDESFHLIAELKPDIQAQYISYKDIFLQTIHIDPLTITNAQLQKTVFDSIGPIEGLHQPNRTECLDLLFSHLIEPTLSDDNTLYFIYYYPPEQAALAQTTSYQEQTVAKRFEIFWRGVELANGYEELLDADLLHQRFIKDNEIRQQIGSDTRDIDMLFLQAHQSGIKPCSGIALGLDRLLMLLINEGSIESVLSFR